MNATNLKLIWRNLWKNANISAVNILGLSVSLAICTLIVLFLQFEYSFDRSNPDQQDMYRLLTTFKYPNSPERQTAMASPMMGPFLERESGAIEQYLRVMHDNENFLCRSGGQEVAIGKSLQVDSTFFSFFDFPLLYGDRANAFQRPEDILLTRPVSEALFGETDPIGKIIEYTFPNGPDQDTTVHYVVSAVFDDLPDNSHLQFDALTWLDDRIFSHADNGNRWHGVSTNTYFKCRPSAGDADEIAATFPVLLKKEMPNSEMVGVSLQPFSDIHLGSMPLEYDNNNFEKSDRKYMKVLGLVALFILLISCINFANLSTVLAMRRVQEVGVRKSLGASNSHVLGQFLGEAVLLSALGGALALFWVEMMRIPFLALIGRGIDLTISPTIILAFIAAVIFLGLLAGLFPAIQAARYSAVEAFQRKGTSVSAKRPFVQRLVVVQFVLAGMLIIGSVISHSQLQYLQNKDLGFRYDQVLELNIGSSNWAHAASIKKELAAIPGVVEVSGSDVSLGEINGQNGVLVRNEKTREFENFVMSINRVNHNFFDLYEMEFVAGQAPTEESTAGEKAYVVNESFVKKVGWKNDPIGQEVLRNGYDRGQPGRVVGVIKDIHHNTLHHQITPICFQVSDFTPIISLKVNPADMKAVLAQCQQVWNSRIKDRPFTFEFMDDHFAQLYLTENRLGRLLLAATILAILIACLGLLALSAFIIQQRTKEIGIRKVLGATTAGLVGLLSKDFLQLVVIALAIASPLAYYFMDNWLADFAYRISIQWWVFAVAGLTAVTVAFLTVGFQSVKAALANPVESLRSE